MKINKIIQSLIDMNVDGETTQIILEKVGMDAQMLRQLIMTLPTEDTEALLKERKELDTLLNK